MADDPRDPAPAGRLPGHGELEDPAVLKAFAHPLRQRILEELGARGHARAADLAAALAVPANSLSFHLRELARYELVDEAPELARDRRDRVWRPRYPQGFSISPRRLREAPGGEVAVAAWSRQSAASARAEIDRAWELEARGEEHLMISHVALRLTDAESQEMSEELMALHDRWRTRGQEGESERRTFVLLEVLQPVDRGEPA